VGSGGIPVRLLDGSEYLNPPTKNQEEPEIEGPSVPQALPAINTRLSCIDTGGLS
jgi:hypothetical protein